VTRLATTLVLAASIGASAGLCIPAEASAAARGRAHASAQRGRTHASSCARGAARRHSSKAHKSSCTAVEHRRTSTSTAAARRAAIADGAAPSLSRLRAAAGPASKAVTIARTLATPCQDTNLTPEPANLARVRAAVLCLVNAERARNGLEPLQSNPQLSAAAESHGREMIAGDYFAHVSPAGVTPVDRARGAGYIPSPEVGYVIGENLAWGTLTLSTPAAIVAAWINSPEHLANILEDNYRETGIDVQPEAPASLVESAQGALYTQEFGVIVR
jgi:uncharacterized protein YkwD